MDRRVHLVVLFAVVVALAGCSGGTPGAGTTTAETDAATSAAGTDGEQVTSAGSGSEAALQTGEAAIQTFSYPDGATPDGITDLDTLLEAHSAALAGDSFTMNGSVVLSISSAGESDTTPVNYNIQYDAADEEVLTTVGGLTAGTLTAYTDGSAKYYRIESESGTEYGSASPDEIVVDGAPEEETGEELLRSLLQRGNFTATGVLTRNGTDLVRYNLTTVQEDVEFDVGERTYDGYLLVDSDGVIHEADLSMSAEGTDSFAFTYDAHIGFTDIGTTTVEEPSWVGQAD
jgi:hypothetical protein